MAEKIRTLRIFPDEAGKMNRDGAAHGVSLINDGPVTILLDSEKQL